MKKCSRCKQKQPLDKFGKNKSTLDGYSYYCRKCRHSLHVPSFGNLRKQKNGLLWCNGPCQQFLQPDDFTIDNGAKSGRKSVCRRCTREHDNIKVSYRFTRYKSDAKRRGLVFELESSTFDLITSQPCYYCEGFNSGKTFTGIDRINGDVGYIIGNCVPCCSICNFMKQSLHYEDFISRILIIAKRFDTKSK